MATKCSVAACDAPTLARGWCEAHCRRWRRYGDPLVTTRPSPGTPVEERLWRRIDRSGGADGCWPWTGCRYPDGYGQIRVGGRNGRTVSVRRLMYGLAHPDDPLGSRWCLHSCDNPPCCNPHHLYAGDHADNMRDRFAGRPGRVARGETNASSRLSVARVRELTRIASGDTQAAIAHAFGVHESTVGLAASRKTWAHV